MQNKERAEKLRLDIAYELNIPEDAPGILKLGMLIEQSLNDAEKRGRIKMKERCALHAPNHAVIRALPVDE